MRELGCDRITREETIALARRWRQSGDEDALHRLVRGNVALAGHESIAFSRFNIDENDLFQAALVGLTMAARSYNPDLGAFSSYARRRIRAALVELVSRATRTGVSIGNDSYRRKAVLDLGAARERIFEAGETPTTAMIARALDVSEEIAAALDGATRPPVYIDKPSRAAQGDEETTQGFAHAVAGTMPDAETELIRSERERALEEAIAELPFQSRDIVVAIMIEGEKVGAMARRLRVPRKRIEQTLTDALAQLRQHLDRALR
jgi:RNA polymerase sigma-32 factor